MSTPKQILVIDVEATCWPDRPPNKYPEQRNEIIEIGITCIDLKTYTLGPKRPILVIPPTTEINEFCTELTSITPELIAAEGIPFADAIAILDKEYRADRNIWASYGKYDDKAFLKNCTWNGVKYPFNNDHINIKALFAAKHKEGMSLDKAVKHLGMTWEGKHHRGVDDAYNAAKVLVKLLT